ncbi:MAG: hypothetical protein J6V38_08085 [Kiritimatiellae bacterium]|nr:hypothetical protein [Kiritimatiellia bacterium]
MNIYLSSDNPAKVLETLELSQYTQSRHHIWNVPYNFETLRVYLHRPSAKKGFFQVDGTLLPSGVWRFDIAGGMLPDVGEATYEVFGVEYPGGNHERREFLGGGLIRVTERNQDAAPATVLEVPERVVIYDEAGAAHYLTAVPDGMGNYTSIVE